MAGNTPRDLMHFAIRRLTRGYPFTAGAALFNILAEVFLPKTRAPRWVVAEGYDLCPSLELDLRQRLQRKTFYFPKAYARYYLRQPLARFMKWWLRPGDTFLDIGANLGFYTFLGAQLVGKDGNVYAVEADPRTFESLRRSVSRNAWQQVACLNVALSDREGEAFFFRDPNGLASSLVPESPAKLDRYNEALRVPVRSFDVFTTKCAMGLSALRLIKIDVEGEESHTVRGMRETLMQAGCPPIWCEVRGPRGSTRAPNSFADVKRLLAALGYLPYRVTRSLEILLEDDLRVGDSDNVLFQHQ